MSHKAFLLWGIVFLVLGLLVNIVSIIGIFTPIITDNACLTLVEVGMGLVIGGAILLAEAKKKDS